MSGLPGAEALLAEARERTSLHDAGDPWFLEPLRVLIESLRRDARLNDAGVRNETERLIGALVNRLRLIDACRRAPGIARERVDVAAVVVGLPRTGSTLLHRLLASVPSMTALRWWEICNCAPWPGERPGHPDERRRAGQELIDAMLAGNPDLAAGHPYQVDGVEEETMILGQSFMGTLAEGFAHVPGYVEWLKTADQRPAYRELRGVLQSMQWFDPARRGRRWVLKSPAHLASLEALRAEFPEATLVVTHRDPLQTIPSLCSLITMLQGLETDAPDRIESGRFIAGRWAWNLEHFTALRRQVPPDKLLDVDYGVLLRDPVTTAVRVLRSVGQEVSDAERAALHDWLAQNRREQHPAHRYAAEEFGITTMGLERMFAAYRAEFVPSARSPE
jgi:hypothetical protein